MKEENDSQVDAYNENTVDEMLEAQAELAGMTKEEFQVQMMRQMFTPTERKIMSMSEEAIRSEFVLIQAKTSNLSSRERVLVEGMFKKLDSDGSK